MKNTIASSLIAGVVAATAAHASLAHAEAPTVGQHRVVVAAPASEGAPKEVTVVADLPAVKIVAITLRAGTTLPDHKASVPVTIQAAHGAATILVDGVKTELTTGSFIVLDANVVHAVTPVSQAPVTVLVHQHKAGGR